MIYLATFHNTDDNVTGLVFRRGELNVKGGAYAAALRDDDSGHIVGCISILPTLDKAIDKARGFVGCDDATRNMLARASAKHLRRRFSGARLTGFGGLQ